MKLIRQGDNLVKEGKLQFVVFSEEGIGKDLQDTPCVGCSAIVDYNPAQLVKLNEQEIYFPPSFQWMTSQITEVVSDTEFYTNNSHYKIEN